MERDTLGRNRVLARPVAGRLVAGVAGVAVLFVIVAATLVACVGRVPDTPSSGSPSGESPEARPSAPALSPAPAPPTVPALVVGGWRWHEVGLRPDVNTAVIPVRNGYFGRCGEAMCTSANGWAWRVPADPAIFSADGATLFSPLSAAHGPDGDLVVTAAEGVWYSPDGTDWRASAAPIDGHGFRAVVYGVNGYTLVGSPDDVNGGRSRLYGSSDGATWTDLGLGPMVGILAQGDTAGGILDQTAKTSTGPAFGYSADGRTWVTATIPANDYPWAIPDRLADGSLVVQGGEAILRSTDGRTWAALQTGWQPGSMAVTDDRIVAVESDSAGTVWESSDHGATFRKLMDGASRVDQFGDLILLGTNTGGVYVGAPLSPSESVDTTPTATGLPASSPKPTPTPEPTPAGGISKDEAINVATKAAHPTAAELATVTASAERDNRYGRWIWSVSFVISYDGPVAMSGIVVDIDFLTGEVLATGNWIS